MTTPNAGLLLLQRAVKVSIITALLVTALSLVLLDWVFSFSVFVGGVFAVGNTMLLEWMARRWLLGQRAKILPVLVFKLWIAALVLYAALRFLPIEIPGLVLGMGSSLVALLWASAQYQNLLKEATEQTNDA